MYKSGVVYTILLKLIGWVLVQYNKKYFVDVDFFLLQSKFFHFPLKTVCKRYYI